MISSFFVVICQLLRRTDHRRFIASLSADAFDGLAHCRDGVHTPLVLFQKTGLRHGFAYFALSLRWMLFFVHGPLLLWNEYPLEGLCMAQLVATLPIQYGEQIDMKFDK